MQFEDNFSPQLFNLKDDPWELHDVAAANQDKVAALAALLAQEYDIQEADRGAKAFQKALFDTWVYQKNGGAGGCVKHMKKLFGNTFNEKDAKKAATWLGKPCN
jgi:hypothetical protein